MIKLKYLLIFCLHIFSLNSTDAGLLCCFHPKTSGESTVKHDSFGTSVLQSRKCVHSSQEIKQEFVAYNRCVPYHKYDMGLVNQYIEMAAEAESQYSDEIIVYHGQTVHQWLLQLFAKKVLGFNDAKDWLPLRFTDEFGDVTADDLIKARKFVLNDHYPEFTKMGMAAHINLVASSYAESASWVFNNCWPWELGKKISAFDILDHIPKFKPRKSQLENSITQRMDAILWWIAWRMDWQQTSIVTSVATSEYKDFFPSLSTDDILRIEGSWKRYVNGKTPGVGVILQIITPPEVASRYFYAAVPFGKPAGEPFLSMYQGNKNKKDAGQLRIAMGYPFTRSPSPVKVKAITPLVHDHFLMETLDKMMDDTANLVRSQLN